MEMWMMWRIRVDMRNQGDNLPDWFMNTSYWYYSTPHRDSYLPHRRWYIESHMKFAQVPVSHDGFPHHLSSLFVSSSTLPSPKNAKLSHPSLSLHAMIKSLHWIQYTPSTAYTEYCMDHVLHHPMIDCLPLPAILSSLGRPCCTQFSTFPQFRVNQWKESQLTSHFPPELPPPDWPPPSTPPISLDHGLQVHLQTRLIIASKWISRLAQSQPPSESANSLEYGLHVRTITASESIPKSTRLLCGAMVELEGGQPIIDTAPHLEWHPKVRLENERFCLVELRNRVRGYQRIPSHDEPHILQGSMNAWQECLRNHTNCIDLWKLGKSVWDQELGKKECGFCIMR